MSFKCCFGILRKTQKNHFDMNFNSNSNSNSNSEILIKHNPRQILTSEYIRLIIDSSYEPTLNWFDFASIYGITAFLQREYSPLITSDMVYEALILEPHYKISHRMDAPGCRFIRHKISK